MWPANLAIGLDGEDALEQRLVLGGHLRHVGRLDLVGERCVHDGLLPPLELRAALLAEGRDAFAVVLRLDQDRLAEALDGPARLKLRAHAVLEPALGDAERMRRRAGQPLRRRARSG